MSGVGMKATVHDLGLLCRIADSSLDSWEPCLDFFLGCVTYSRSTIRSAKTLLSSRSTDRYTLPTWLPMWMYSEGNVARDRLLLLSVQ